MNNIKRNFLIFAFLAISPVALFYGVSPGWYAANFLGIETLDTNMTHILRAIMGLYLALSVFWLFSAFSEALRNPAILSFAFFVGGVLAGRLLSVFADGQPAPVLVLYLVGEIMLIPAAIWAYRSPS